jgi:hypothetical protein
MLKDKFNQRNRKVNKARKEKDNNNYKKKFLKRRKDMIKEEN